MVDSISRREVNGLRQTSWLRLLLVILGYMLLTVVFTRPIAWKTGDGFVANLPADGDGSYPFNPYHLQNCLENGTDCRRTDLQCFPIGNSLALNTNMPIPSLLAVMWGNTTKGLNIILLLNCFLVAFGGYKFARLFVQSDVLAFVVGALFAFWMGRSAHLWHGHANLMFAAPLPFAMYALHRAWPNLFADELPLGGFKLPWFAAFVGLTMVTALHDFILAGFIVIYVGLMVLVLVYRTCLFQRRWFWQLLVLIAFVVLVDQLTQWMLRWGFDNNAATYFSGSLKHFFYPHPVSELYARTVFGDSTEVITESGFDIGRVMFGGVALMLFALSVVLMRLVKQRGFALGWMLIVFILGVLYTMPLFRWGNGRWIYGPFSFTHFLPMWNENRCPTRLADLLMLLGPLWLMANLERTDWWEGLRLRTRIFLGVGLAVVLLAEHIPRGFFFVEFKNRPAVYSALEKSTEPCAMFVPFGLVDGKKSLGKMWLEPFAYQPMHRRKMYNGFLSRIEQETFDFFKSDSFAIRLVRNEKLEDDLRDTSFVLDTCLYLPLDSAETLKSLQKLQLKQLVVKPGLGSMTVTKYINATLRPYIVQDTMFAEGHRWILLRW
jgi:hypothetical protein